MIGALSVCQGFTPEHGVCCACHQAKPMHTETDVCMAMPAWSSQRLCSQVVYLNNLIKKTVVQHAKQGGVVQQHAKQGGLQAAVMYK